MNLFTVEQLSRFIHKSPSSIRSDLTRNPSSLPPSFVIPGSRRRLFKDVDLWIESLINDQPSEVEMPMRARRGRPTKAEQVSASRLRVLNLKGDIRTTQSN